MVASLVARTARGQCDALGHLARDIEVDSYAALIRRCSLLKSLQDGKWVHAKIVRDGHDRNLFLSNLLVQMYGKCGSLDNARLVFDGVKHKNLYTWNIMIAAYAQMGHPQEALRLYAGMGSEPNEFTFTSVLSACSSIGPAGLQQGQGVHSRILRLASSKPPSVILQTAIVNMYAKCGRVDVARKVFDGIADKTAVSWNAMIAAYAQAGHHGEAVRLYERMEMENEGVRADKVTFASVLAACTSVDLLQKVHVRIVERGFDKGVVVATALVNMYARCGCLVAARRVFEHMKERNLVSWNTMITGYAQFGRCMEAVELFRRMDLEGTCPDDISFAIVLSGCWNLGLAEGRVLHAEAAAKGVDTAVLVRTALVTMYARCGRLDVAKELFENMKNRDVVAWNSVIAACVQHGQPRSAVEYYRQMDVEPDKGTLTSVLSACSVLGDLAEGKEIHARVLASSSVEKTEVSVQNALLNMYAKCGRLEMARELFDGMQDKNVVTVNVMVAAYTQQGYGNEAIEVFRHMDLLGIQPDDATFTSVVTACSCVGALKFGKLLHSRIIASDMHHNVVIGTALVSMYGKCGTLEEARDVFGGMNEKNAVSWNAMLAACAHQGEGDEAVFVSRAAAVEGVDLDATSYISLLIACSHSGLLADACDHFATMVSDWNILPVPEHFRCMVDILGRAGRLPDAEDLVSNMPFQPDAITWRTLLGSCRTHGNPGRAAEAAELAFRLDTDNTAPYILLSNIYAAAGKHADMVEVRAAIRDKGVKKLPGKSFIEVHGRVHEFVAGDIDTHARAAEIRAELDRLGHMLKDAGYVADTKEVLHDVREEEKAGMLGLHSEKLALAFGLISTAPGTHLHILKNIRVCSDCHAAIKLIAKLARRKVTLRDANRFHLFQDGKCSCGDYW